MKIKGLLELSVSIFQKNDSGLPRVIYKSSTGQLETQITRAERTGDSDTWLGREKCQGRGLAGRTLEVCGEHGFHSMTKGTRTTFRELEMLIPLGEYFPENLEYSIHK